MLGILVGLELSQIVDVQSSAQSTSDGWAEGRGSLSWVRAFKLFLRFFSFRP